MTSAGYPIRTMFTDTFLLALFFTVIAIVGSPWNYPSYAIGPNLPLSFEDLPDIKDPWNVVLRVDPEQMRVARVERNVYVGGEKLRTEAFDPRFERQVVDGRVESRAQIPLRFGGMEELKQRAFAQKIVIEGRWLKEQAAKPLHLERWFYFIAEGGNFRRVSLEEYSNFTDRAESGIDSRGRQGLLYRGRDVEGDVSLRETKSTPAVPVGRLGGAVEERVTPDRDGVRKEKDLSEVHEK